MPQIKIPVDIVLSRKIRKKIDQAGYVLTNPKYDHTRRMMVYDISGGDIDPSLDRTNFVISTCDNKFDSITTRVIGKHEKRIVGQSRIKDHVKRVEQCIDNEFRVTPKQRFDSFVLSVINLLLVGITLLAYSLAVLTPIILIVMLLK